MMESLIERRCVMTEIKTGNSKPNNYPYCRCRCSLEGLWFPLEFNVETATYDVGGCGCGDGPTENFAWA